MALPDHPGAAPAAAPNRSLAPAAETDTMEIDLVELLYRLLEKAKYIAAAAVAGAIIAAVITVFFVTPTYTATAKLYVVNTNSAVIDLSALQLGTQLASDYKEVFKNWHVHERVIERLELPYSYAQLNNMVTVANAGDATRILAISVVSTSPDEAKLMADTYADVAREFIADKMSTQQPNIFEEARRPSASSAPNRTRNIILGFLLGALIAAGVVVVQFVVDDRVHSEEDITRYFNLPVLGIMPEQQSASTLKRNTAKQPEGTQP